MGDHFTLFLHLVYLHIHYNEALNDTAVNDTMLKLHKRLVSIYTCLPFYLFASTTAFLCQTTLVSDRMMKILDGSTILDLFFYSGKEKTLIHKKKCLSRMIPTHCTTAQSM